MTDTKPTRTRTQNLPARLKAVYEFIIAFKQANDGCPPTWAEIGMNVIGSPATSLVSFYLDHLVKLGKIEKRGRNNIVVIGGKWTPPAPTEKP